MSDKDGENLCKFLRFCGRVLEKENALFLSDVNCNVKTINLNNQGILSQECIKYVCHTIENERILLQKTLKLAK